MSDDKEEVKELSLEDQIREAMEPKEEDKQEGIAEQEPVGKPPEEVAETPAEEEVKEDSEPEDVAELLAVPENWDQTRQEAFTGLGSEEARQTYLDTVKSLERGFQKKFDDLATVRKEHETIVDLLQPFEAQLQASGLDRIGGIRSLVGAQQLLTQNPLQGLTQLLQQYGGINAKTIIQQIAQSYGIGKAAEDSQAYQDPEILALQTRLDQQELVMQQNETNTQQQRMLEAQNQITLFEKALDNDGNVKHPHFQTVKEKMSQLITSGLADNMDSAYDQAIYLDTGLRGQLMEAGKKEVAEKLNITRKTKVDNSKKAAKNVKTNNVAPESQPGEPDNVRDSVLKTLEAMG